MLQQTRVAAVIPYYERFLDEFPTIEALANAEEERLLECWSGLGYYRRARQMQDAARRIAGEFGGVFPRTHDELILLPGIGAYTAAAIASISFHESRAVVDGNVIRVLARLFDETGDSGTSAVSRRIQRRAQKLIACVSSRNAGPFNQAMMELGAMVCTARSPRCLVCPVHSFCRARQRGVQLQRPVKRKNARTEHLQMAVALVQRGSSLLMRQRPAGESLMPGFWELPAATGKKLTAQCLDDLGILPREKLGEFRHAITFREYRGSVYHGELIAEAANGLRWVSAKRLRSLPLTTVTKKALRVARQNKPPM